jgi:dTDP-4-dehydrorhamnose 3,5-epimerase
LDRLIDGVQVIPLKLVLNERGRLMEVLRRDEPWFAGFGQIYITRSLNGVVKAWYRHHHQIDQIAAITGGVKLALYDDRQNSATKGLVNEILMGESEPKLVRIPPGVWHGFKAIDSDPFLVHINTEPHDFEKPDEDRLPPDDMSIPYQW